MHYMKFACLLLIIIQLVENTSESFASNAQLMFNEMNNVRTDPKSLIPYLQTGISEFVGNVRNGISTAEGPSAWYELINVLNSISPLAPMTWSNGMANACQIFIDWQGPSGETGHTGPNGKTMSERISEQGQWVSSIGENMAYGKLDGKESLVQLMVDDNVPSRGHRNNILSNSFGKVGIAIGSHSTYSYVTGMDFAADFISSQDANPTYTWSANSNLSTNSNGCSSDQIFYCKTENSCICLKPLEGCEIYSAVSGYCTTCKVFYKINKYQSDGGYCQLRWE